MPFAYHFFKRKHSLRPYSRSFPQQNAYLASPSSFKTTISTTWRDILAKPGFIPVVNLYKQESGRLATAAFVEQHAEFMNACKRFDGGYEGLNMVQVEMANRHRAAEEILKRFGTTNPEDLVIIKERAALAERDTRAWNRPESGEEKSQSLTEKPEVGRISGKGMEGRDIESEDEDESEKECKDNDEDAEEVTGRGLRQWTFWF